MSAEILESSCPVDHGDFSDEQNLTGIQDIVQRAAIDVDKYPLLATERTDACSHELAVRYLYGRDSTSPAHYLTEHELMSNARRVIPQALGFRAVYSAMPGIKETLESGFGGADALSAEYDAPFGHTHTGDEALLMRLVSGKIGRMALRTFGSFTMDQRLALQDSFSDRTRLAAESTVRALDSKYGSAWRHLPKEVKQAPYESGLKDRFLVRLLGRLAHRSYFLETSFYNAAISGAESGTIMLKHFRDALHAAGCPQSLWAPLAYANAAKLSAPSMMAFRDAKELHEVNIQEQSQPVFWVHQQNGSWQVEFVNPKHQRVYNRNRPAGCQGAFVLPPQNEDRRGKLLDWHEFMTQRSAGLKMDTDYRQGATAAQMAIISAIVVADREEYFS